jgi:hypothetical protein
VDGAVRGTRDRGQFGDTAWYVGEVLEDDHAC